MKRKTIVGNLLPIVESMSESGTDSHEYEARDVELGSSTFDASLVGLLRDRMLGVNILDVIRLNLKKDPAFRKVIENPKAHKNFILSDGLLYLRENGRELLCIPEHVVIDGRSLREIIISEAHSVLAHLGVSKTRTYMRDHV